MLSTVRAATAATAFVAVTTVMAAPAQASPAHTPATASATTAAAAWRLQGYFGSNGSCTEHKWAVRMFFPVRPVDGCYWNERGRYYYAWY